MAKKYLSDVDDVGAVDMFGLDEFGAPIGLAPLYGAAGGAAVQTLTSYAVKQWASEYEEWSEAIGGAVGVVAGAVAYFAAPKARGAASAMMAVSAVNGLLRTLVPRLVKQEEVSGWGDIAVEQVNGLGDIQTEQVSGDDSMPEVLNSAALAEENQKIAMLDGPTISGLGVNYGATIFGSRTN